MAKHKKRDPIPEFDTLEEIAEFWDTHSTADYDDVTHEVHFDIVKMLVADMPGMRQNYMERKMTKNSLHVRLDHDLVDFIQVYAQEHRTTVSDVMTQFLLTLKRQEEGNSMELILAHPDFHQAIRESQTRLRNGTAEWHTYEDVFGA